MELILLFGLLICWGVIGSALLAYAQETDAFKVALLAPTMGLAMVTVTLSTTSVLGLPLRVATWPTLGTLVAAALAYLWHTRAFFTPANLAALVLPSAVAAVLLALVAAPVVEVGGVWQGLVNADAAFTSLGAQYFIKEPFFGQLNAEDVIQGKDYSDLTATVNVAGGHRFADAMLLGMSAVLSGAFPDRVVMTHGLALNVAFCLVCAALVIRQRASPVPTMATVALLCFSSICAYVYLNQLIAQVGGLALMSMSLILLAGFLDRRSTQVRRRRSLWLSSICVSALFRYYPEALPIFLLACLVLASLHREVFFAVVDRGWTVRQIAFAFVIVVVLSNVTFPHTLAHVLAVLGVGVVKDQTDRAGALDFIFTPDIVPLLYGFLQFRQEVADPLATAYMILAVALLALATLTLVRCRASLSVLFAVVLSLTLALFAMLMQRETFKAFKALLYLHPFLIVLTITAPMVLYRRGWLLSAPLFLVFAYLNWDPLSRYDATARADVHPVPYFVRDNLLDKLGDVASSGEPVMLDSQSFLFQNYASVRNKPHGLLFATDLPSASDNESKFLASYHAWIAPQWRHALLDFRQRIAMARTRQLAETRFGCSVGVVAGAMFETRRDSSDVSAKTIFPGGKLQPLNRVAYADLSLADSKRLPSSPWLAQRESTLGRWEYNRDTVDAARSLFFPERDPTGVVDTMAAVGRYVLLEVFAPDQDRVRLRVAFTRTFLGPDASSLPLITIHGQDSVTVGGHGAGALDEVSEPVLPCIIGGRRFLFVDFGVDPLPIVKSSPLAYQWLGMRYSPDRRMMVGFLRDLSIMTGSTSRAATFTTPWVKDPEAAQLLGFSGIYEDGWVSDDARLIIGNQDSRRKLKLRIELDPSLVPPGEDGILVEWRSGGEATRQMLRPGENVLSSAALGDSVLLRLRAEQPARLGNGDGRRVIGRIVAIEWE